MSSTTRAGDGPITEPGIYRMSAAHYHSDPCPTPSLTQTIAKVLITRSPLHAFHAHPKLNPAWAPREEEHFDLGKAAHTMLLGEGAAIVALPFPDWRTKAAREARDEYRAAGRTPLLEHQVDRVGTMIIALTGQAKADGFNPRDGDSEVALIWREGDIWLRTLIDKLSIPRLLVRDYKTTDLSVAPDAVDRLMVSSGWDVQAAMHERALGVFYPDFAGRWKHEYICQETSPPYAMIVLEIGEAALTMGRKKLQYAIDVWADCLRANRWPGYQPRRVQASYPAWAESAWLAREMEADENETY